MKKSFFAKKNPKLKKLYKNVIAIVYLNGYDVNW